MRMKKSGSVVMLVLSIMFLHTALPVVAQSLTITVSVVGEDHGAIDGITVTATAPDGSSVAGITQGGVVVLSLPWATPSTLVLMREGLPLRWGFATSRSGGVEVTAPTTLALMLMRDGVVYLAPEQMAQESERDAPTPVALVPTVQPVPPPFTPNEPYAESSPWWMWLLGAIGMVIALWVGVRIGVRETPRQPTKGGRSDA